MRFRPSHARGVHRSAWFDKNSLLVGKLDYQLRKSELVDPATGGYSHAPENDFALVEYSKGQYARLCEGGLYDLLHANNIISAFSPIYIADDADFITSTQPIAPNGWFGDGSDGNVTLAVNTVLGRDMFYNNLTIPNGITLTPAGYRVFVRGTLQLDGIIDSSGSNGTNGGAGGNGDLASPNGSGGGLAGVGGTNYADGYLGAGSPYTAITNVLIGNAFMGGNDIFITTAHDVSSADPRWIVVAGVTGVPNANGTFLAVRVDASRLELLALFTGAYTGGGQWNNVPKGGDGAVGSLGVGNGVNPGVGVSGYSSPAAAPNGFRGSPINNGIGAIGALGSASGKGGNSDSGTGIPASGQAVAGIFNLLRDSFPGYLFGDPNEVFTVMLGRVMPSSAGVPIIIVYRAQGMPSGGGSGGGGGANSGGAGVGRAGGGGGGAGSGASGIPLKIFAYKIFGTGFIQSNGGNGGVGGNGGNATVSDSNASAGGGGGGGGGSSGHGGLVEIGSTFIDATITIRALAGLVGNGGMGGTHAGFNSQDGGSASNGLPGSPGLVRTYLFV